MTKGEFCKHLIKLLPCTEACHWVIDSRAETAEQLYGCCERGDWLLWLAARIGVSEDTVTLAACAVARMGLKHLGESAERPLAVIEYAEKATDGLASDIEIGSAIAAMDAEEERRSDGPAVLARSAVRYAARSYLTAWEGAVSVALADDLAMEARHIKRPPCRIVYRSTLEKLAKVVRIHIPFETFLKALTPKAPT